MSYTIIHADVIEGLRQIPDASVHCCVTSPPYMALRDYGIPPRTWSDGSVGVLGAETSLHTYVDHLVEIFSEVRRVLHPSGTFWLNLGDSYLHNGPQPSTGLHKRNGVPLPETYKREKVFKSKKQLGMIPARVALACQDDGWILRQDIIWAKGLSFCPTYSGSVMPESIQDRAVWSHEHLFHFSMRDKYFYDLEGCREPYAEGSVDRYKYAFGGKKNQQLVAEGRLPGVGFREYKGQATKAYMEAHAQNPSDVKRRVMQSMEAGVGRNLRNVWVIGKEPLKEAHFAAFPVGLITPVVKLATSAHGQCPTCHAPWVRNLIKEPVPQHIKDQFEASRMTSERDLGRGDGYTHRKPNYRRKVLGEGWLPGCDHNLDPIPCTVLDIFNGSGRAGVAALRQGRDYIGIEAKAEYCDIARKVLDKEMESRGVHVHGCDIETI